MIEILSSGTAERDQTTKRDKYFEFGVREYWIVDPEARTIELLKAEQPGFETAGVYPEGTTATSPLLKGLRIDVSNTFAAVITPPSTG